MIEGRINDDVFKDLVKRCARPWHQDARKAKARERWLIYTENHKPLIANRLEETLNNATYREEIAKHIDLSDNPALDVMRSTCVVWVQGARRTTGSSARTTAAFTELVTESLLDVHALQWNRIAEFVGPLIVIPAVRKETLRWDVLLPTYYDVVVDDDDPHGAPLAVAWTIRGDGSKKVDRPDVVVLDGHSWRYVSTAQGQLRLIGDEVEHGLGRFPGAVLRFDTPLDADWFGQPTRHQRFVDASISVGVINSVLAFTRKAQNSKLLTTIGFLGDAAKEQPLDPETGIAINIDTAPGKQPPKVEALDFDTPPRNFIDHANSVRRSVAAAYGGTLDETGKLLFDLDALAEVRNEQIPHARVFERQLWTNAVAMCRSMRHPLATKLPDEKTLKKSFAVDFGKLSRTFADPKQEAEHLDWLISKGALDQLDVLRKQGNESLDDEQLKRKLEENLENQSWFNDAVTTRNLSMTAKGAQTAPQAFGALGPMVRDAKTDAPEGAPKKPEGT